MFRADSVQAHQPLFVLRGHNSGVLSGAFCPSVDYQCASSNLFLSGDVDGRVLLWDLTVRRSPLWTLDAVAEAHRQQNSDPPERYVNCGVLEVGFLCFGYERAKHTHDGSSGGKERLQREEPGPSSTLVVSRDSDVNSNARPRFRLRRPVPQFFERNSSESTATANTSAAVADTSPSIYFYTQCRNQRLYLWEWSPSKTQCAIRLLHCLPVGQYGFCPVSCSLYFRSRDEGRRCQGEAYVAVPHDAEGLITIWRVALSSSSAGSVRPQARQPGQYANPESPLLLSHVCTFSASPDFKGGALMRICMQFAYQETEEAPAKEEEEEGEEEVLDQGRRQHLPPLLRISVALESGHISLCEGALPPLPSASSTITTPTSTLSFMTVAVVTTLRAFPESALCCLWRDSRVLATSAEGNVHCYTLSRPSSPSSVSTPSLLSVWEVTLRKGIGSTTLQSNMAILGCWDGTTRLYDARTGRLLTILCHHSGTINAISAPPEQVVRQLPFAFDVRRPRCYEVKQQQLHAPAALVHPSSSSPSSPSSPLVKPPETVIMTETAREGKYEERRVFVFASMGSDYTVAVWRVDLNVIDEELRKRIPLLQQPEHAVKRIGV